MKLIISVLIALAVNAHAADPNVGFTKAYDESGTPNDVSSISQIREAAKAKQIEYLRQGIGMLTTMETGIHLDDITFAPTVEMDGPVRAAPVEMQVGDATNRLDEPCKVTVRRYESYIPVCSINIFCWGFEPPYIATDSHANLNQPGRVLTIDVECRSRKTGSDYVLSHQFSGRPQKAIETLDFRRVSAYVQTGFIGRNYAGEP